MNVLVTGALGFVGTAVCRELARNGHRVIGCDDLSGGSMRNKQPGIDYWVADVTKPSDVENMFALENYDAVYHLAAYAAEGLSPFIRRFNYTNNLIGSVNVINACINHQVPLLVFTSSIAVYGNQYPPFTEQQPLYPIDPYAVAKQAVEQDIRCAHETHGLNYVVFRPFNIYGPYQNLNDSYRNVCAIFIRACLENKPIQIFGDGLQQRAFSYIDDVAPIMAEVIGRPDAWNQTVNIGGGQPYTVLELAKTIKEEMQSDVPIIHLPERHEAKAAWCVRDKLVKYFPQAENFTSLREGIRLMAEWARIAPLDKPSVFGNIEVRRNLPPSWAKLV